MISSRPVFLIATALYATVAFGQTAVYQPLSTWTDPLDRQTAKVARSMNLNDRPLLPGFRSRNVELLQDALLRKHSRLLGKSGQKARQLIGRRYAKSPAQLEGIMTEALFLDANPDWGYVRKPNAPQHDVFGWQAGRKSPVTGQIKYHRNGDPATYARDMRKDWRAERFLIPDDHVEKVQLFWEREARRLTLNGSTDGTRNAWRNRARVRRLGQDSHSIAARTKNAAQAMAVEKYATYTSFGASLAVSFGPIMWDWANGGIQSHQALYRATRTLSLIGVGVGTDLLLSQVAIGALRGSLRGNLIVGTALSITEVSWLLYEHGWSRAFFEPRFYEEVGGGLGAIAVGTTGFVIGTAMASETGPWAPVIGTGVGVVTGTVAYVGGRRATHMILDILVPEMIQQREQEQVVVARATIDRQIGALVKLK